MTIPEAEPPDVAICERIAARQRARAEEGHEKFGSRNYDASPYHLAVMHLEESVDGCYYGEREVELLGPGPQGQERIFISGPLMDSDYEGVEQNIIAASGMFHRLWRMGHWPFCPHRAVAPDVVLDQSAEERRAWLDWCLAWLPLCHSIILLDGWRYSEGAMEEHKAARKLKLTVYYSPDELPDLRIAEVGEGG